MVSRMVGGLMFEPSTSLMACALKRFRSGNSIMKLIINITLNAFFVLITLFHARKIPK